MIHRKEYREHQGCEKLWYCISDGTHHVGGTCRYQCESDTRTADLGCGYCGCLAHDFCPGGMFHVEYDDPDAFE